MLIADRDNILWIWRKRHTTYSKFMRLERRELTTFRNWEYPDTWEMTALEYITFTEGCLSGPNHLTPNGYWMAHRFKFTFQIAYIAISKWNNWWNQIIYYDTVQKHVAVLWTGAWMPQMSAWTPFSWTRSRFDDVNQCVVFSVAIWSINPSFATPMPYLISNQGQRSKQSTASQAPHSQV